MELKYYRKFYKNLKIFSEQLRAFSTPSERRLWYRICRRQVLGLLFYRQYVMEDYILDFYAPEIKLAIEVDGAHHYETENKKRDKMRDEYLRTLGLIVLRFNNLEVQKELENVLECIFKTVRRELQKKGKRLEGEQS